MSWISNWRILYFSMKKVVDSHFYRKKTGLTINNPLISVIIPAYNASKYVEKVVRSIMEQHSGRIFFNTEFLKLVVYFILPPHQATTILA